MMLLKMNIMLKPFLYLAGLGFILSFVVHVSSLLNLPITIGIYKVLILFLIIFLLIAAFVALIVFQNLSKEVKSKNLWKAVLRGSPTWQKHMLTLFLGYAAFTFILSRIMGGGGGAGSHGLSVNDVREISAFFMAFNFFSIAILYSGIHVRTDVQERRCPNGHLVSPVANFCGECGLEVIDR
jgi:hypothetical protein